MTKREAGSLGGNSTVARYGKDYMQELGRKGAEKFWELYRLVPASISGWLIVNRETGEVKGRSGWTGREV